MPTNGRSLMILGANGRVGRLLQAAWDRQPPPGITLCWQSRVPGGQAGVTWSLAEGAAALAGRIPTGVEVMLVLAGVTPGLGVDYGQNSALAEAALQAAALAGVQLVILASSAAVYGMPASAEPLSETAAIAPVTPYGQSKWDMEVRARRQAAVDLVILRLGNVAGTDQMFRAVTAATTTAPLLLDRFGNGRTPLRSYIGPMTLANCLADLVRLSGKVALPDVLNVAADGGGVEMASLLVALARAGRPVPHRFRVALPGALPALRLECARFLALCPMPPPAGTAAAMVDEWLSLSGAAE